MWIDTAYFNAIHRQRPAAKRQNLARSYICSDFHQVVCCHLTAKFLIDSETYLVFHRPGSHVDIKVYDARVEEHRRLPPAKRLDNLLKYSLMVKAG